VSYVVYGTNKTRVTLYDVDGTTPLQRITLQKEDREGLTLSWKPEGATTKLGSGAGWANANTHHGFRAELAIKWAVGVESASEAWVSGAWGPATILLTAQAIRDIFTQAMVVPCLVEPHLDKAYSFKAQPDPGKAFSLKDVKGVAHTGLELVLIAETLGPIPDWAAL
jgi:hypothetical protein